MSALDGRDIPGSARLLVTHLTDALESDGRRAAEVLVSVRDGHLVLNLSVEQPFGGCMLYELVGLR